MIATAMPDRPKQHSPVSRVITAESDREAIERLLAEVHGREDVTDMKERHGGGLGSVMVKG